MTSLTQKIHYELLHCATKITRSVQKSVHMESLSRLTLNLAEEIEEQCYQPEAYTRFAISDPKLREIYAPSFRDRLAQSWLVYHLNPAVERVLIDDTFANRIGKGTLAAVQRAQHFMRQPQHSHYLQLDIQSFFNSIWLPELMNQGQEIVHRYFQDHPYQEVLNALLIQCITHPIAQNTYTVSGDRTLLATIPPHKTLAAAGVNRGLPLGSAASQLFANLYLNPLDHFIKHTLRIKGYIRYMDDLLLLGNSSAQLSEYRTEIKNILQQKLRLNLHPTKQIIQTNKQGADYLGYKVYPHYLHLRQRSIDKLFAWLRFFNACLGNPPPHRFWIPDTIEWLNVIQSQPVTPNYFLLQRMQALINSYFGLMKNTQHYRLRKKLYQKHFGLLKRYFLPSDANYNAIHIKKYCLQDWIAQQHEQ